MPPSRSPGFTGAAIQVVAVVSERDGFVLRAVAPGRYRPEHLVSTLRGYVGSLDPTLVWTGYTYGGLPWYLCQPFFLNTKAVKIPYGVWRFPILRVYPPSKYPSRYGPDPGDLVLGPATRLGDI
jgi:hypothetical protein